MVAKSEDDAQQECPEHSGRYAPMDVMMPGLDMVGILLDVWSTHIAVFVEKAFTDA